MDFKETYTFRVDREFDTGYTTSHETTCDAGTLAPLLSAFADFLRGSGYTFVKDIVAEKENGDEICSGEEWDDGEDLNFTIRSPHDETPQERESLELLINELLPNVGDSYTFTVGDFGANDNNLTPDEKKKADDLLDNLFKNNKPPKDKK